MCASSLTKSLTTCASSFIQFSIPRRTPPELWASSRSFCLLRSSSSLSFCSSRRCCCSFSSFSCCCFSFSAVSRFPRSSADASSGNCSMSGPCPFPDHHEDIGIHFSTTMSSFNGSDSDRFRSSRRLRFITRATSSLDSPAIFFLKPVMRSSSKTRMSKCCCSGWSTTKMTLLSSSSSHEGLQLRLMVLDSNCWIPMFITTNGSTVSPPPVKVVKEISSPTSPEAASSSIWRHPRGLGRTTSKTRPPIGLIGTAIRFGNTILARSASRTILWMTSSKNSLSIKLNIPVQSMANLPTCAMYTEIPAKKGGVSDQPTKLM
mmetsp:Transcript_66801/g.120240  ORF Transcript_66801/g.120240 Transcript_66801/m.120240 type:complete len:318 (-) Transcript_66801:68-1021(-)